MRLLRGRGEQVILNSLKQGARYLEGHTTLRAPQTKRNTAASRVPCLTILAHPDLSRIGQRCVLHEVSTKEGVNLSRLAPVFASPDSIEGQPLNDPYISRRPVLLTLNRNNSVQVTPREDGTGIFLNGEKLTEPTAITPDVIQTGTTLQLGDRVTLALHYTTQPARTRYRYGLIGDSDAIEELIQRITQVAVLTVPVLLIGPSGAGKELVAKALHEGGPRRDNICISVNMGAIPPTTANSEIFGHTKGAFTGAHRDHSGYFAQSDQGTLFMDEIGECPTDLQVMLLRTLETGEIIPIGATRPQKIDVRLITATDRDLQEACHNGQFREPLFHRIATYQIEVPPLSVRMEDLGRLFLHFLKSELEQLGNTIPMDTNQTEPFIPASLMTQLARYPWPGNVRQLRNVVRQLCISSRGQDSLQADDSLKKLLLHSPDDSVTPVKEEGYRRPDEVSEDEVIKALKEHAYRINPTAKALGLSRTSLYALIDRSTRFRKAGDLTAAQIEEAINLCEGSLDEMSAHLEVSKRGLVLRMTDLGLS